MSAPRWLAPGQPLIPDAGDLAALMTQALEAGWLANGGPLHQRLEAALVPWLAGDAACHAGKPTGAASDHGASWGEPAGGMATLAGPPPGGVPGARAAASQPDAAIHGGVTGAAGEETTAPMTRRRVGSDHGAPWGEPAGGMATGRAPGVAPGSAALAPVAGAGAGGTVRLVSSGTMALMLALRLGGLAEGAEIITPALSFAATAQAIRWCGFRPVFADVDPATLTLCPQAVARAITPRTAAILPVHFLGRCCDVVALGDLAARHGLWLAYDAAHGFGAQAGGRPVAHWGDATAFSLHATKLMHCGEGGAVVLPPAAPAPRVEALARMRNFGLRGGRMAMAGTNAKLSEPQAALGLAVLAMLPAEIAARRGLRAAYDAALAGVAGLAPASDGLVCYALHLPPARRDAAIAALAGQGVMARGWGLVCGPGTDLARAPIISARTAPVAADLAAGLISLPFHGRVTPGDVARIAATLAGVMDQGRHSQGGAG